MPKNGAFFTVLLTKGNAPWLKICHFFPEKGIKKARLATLEEERKTGRRGGIKKEGSWLLLLLLLVLLHLLLEERRKRGRKRNEKWTEKLMTDLFLTIYLFLRGIVAKKGQIFRNYCLSNFSSQLQLARCSILSCL